MNHCTCLCKKHVCKTNACCDPHCKCRENFHSKCNCTPKSLMRLAAEKVFKRNADVRQLPISLQIYVYGTLCRRCWIPPYAPRFIHVLCLRYALFRGYNLYANCLKTLACLRYAVEECGLVLDTSFYEKTCYKNTFDMFKYASEKGVPWNERVCHIAASKGLYDFLVYAHQHGCPWNYRVLREAYLFGHADCLTYAHDHMQDCSPYIINVKFFLREAKKRRKLKTAFILLVRIVWKKCTWFGSLIFKSVTCENVTSSS